MKQAEFPNNMIGRGHLLPNRVALKVIASVFVLYVTMSAVLKNLAPYLYPTSALPSAIFRVEAIALMPAMMIGIGLSALQADKLSFPKILIRSFVASLLASTMVAFGFPIF
ncbi:MAG: hypothetical protein Q8922_05060 [Bacteroidota bacterium]|nr:hypothetical protein [Bacteroidota bacterium]MDP4231929.1 hypothetical protein [Bacteroidota bacterium]MDP4241364.1 hypothetical protein [Bacteroidota bacterium]MDP4287287.1 hypothetical protein [Bacteroidota bacterium]